MFLTSMHFKEIGPKKALHRYICKYSKWRTVVNMTRMQDHQSKKRLSCPNFIKKSSNIKSTQENKKSESQFTSHEVKEQKKVSRR